MKIGILTCVWQRPQVFELFASSVNQLQLPEGMEIIPLAVGSEGIRSQLLCEAKGFHYLEHPNQPLGAKFNAGMRWFKEKDEEKNIDYVMILGSDDYVSPNLIEAYLPHFTSQTDIIGLLDLYFLNIPTAQMVYFPGYQDHRTGQTLGAGRCLSRQCLNLLQWTPWEDPINASLDHAMTQKLKTLMLHHAELTESHFSMKDSNIAVVDIKTGTNITPFHYLAHHPSESLTTLTHWLTPHQRSLLKALGSNLILEPNT